MSWRVKAVILASVSALPVSGIGRVAFAESAPPASACTGTKPPPLVTPEGNALALELLADGVQIYSCAIPPDAPGAAPSWTLVAPEATLRDRGGALAGRHGAGPAWDAVDGSGVVATKVAGVTSDPAAIPALLLRVTSHRGGPGVMSDVTFIQRLATSGGIAPAEGCTKDSVGAIARMPYRAVYCFYRSERAGPTGGGTTPAAGGAPRL